MRSNEFGRKVQGAKRLSTERGKKMETIFATICAAVLAGEVTVSDSTALACINREMPPIYSDGSRFANRGVGAQMNFIVANARHFTFMGS